MSEQVSLFGDHVAVVNKSDDAILVYRKQSNGWNRVATLTTSGNEKIHDVVLYRDVIVGKSVNKLLVYEKNGSWTNRSESVVIRPPGVSVSSVTLSENMIVAHSIGSNSSQNAYYSYEREDTWPSLPTSTFGVGTSVAACLSLDRNVLVASTYQNGNSPKYSIDVYEKQATWTKVATLLQRGPTSLDQYNPKPTKFGVDIHRNTIIVGGEERTDNFIGIAYIFEKTGNSWKNFALTARLRSATGSRYSDFGRNVSISDKRVIVYASSGICLYEKPLQGWHNMNNESVLLTGEFTEGEADIHGDVVVATHAYDVNGSSKPIRIYQLDSYYTEPCASSYFSQSFIATTGQTRKIVSGSVSVGGNVEPQGKATFHAIETVLLPNFHAKPGSTLTITPKSCGEIYNQVE